VLVLHVYPTMPTTTPPEQHSHQAASLRKYTPELLLALAGLYWAFQIGWFWRYCGRTINFDAISYIGIARHIAQGDLKASLHGYWSPLISWLIAVVSFAGGDRTREARLLMLPLFAACMVLTYWLTQKLWNSRLLSAAAVLWFTTARGVAAFSVCFIGADLRVESRPSRSASSERICCSRRWCSATSFCF